VSRRAVEVEVVFLDVLAVVAFVAGRAEDPLFQDGIAPIPQRQGKADVLVTVADAGDAVFVPAVRPRAGMIVGEIFPGGPIRAVVLADRAPGAFAEVRSQRFQCLVRAFDSSRRRCSAVISVPPPLLM